MAEKKNGKRFQIQSISLAVSLLAQFGIYAALQAGSNALAALGFAVLSAAMAVVVAKG